MHHVSKFCFIIFFRAVEVGIMFNCLYMAFWLSNYVTIARNLTNETTWNVLDELGL